jgi:RHS repeat-associated protein
MGNVTGDGARTYVWSAAGLLKEAKIGGTTVGAYTYSANNQRTKKVAGGTTAHYVHGLGGKLYGEYDNSGVLIREYIWLNGEPLAQIDKSGGTETLTYLHTDHLATPRYGTNAAGSTVWTWDSGAFGKEAPTGTATVNLRFPGQYYDAETTLHYNWNRYYNPAIGRYISSDPIGLAGGLATYSYASLNPLVFIDPKGLINIGWSGYKFRSEKGAAIDAIKLAWGDRRVSFNELAGIIYRKGACYGYDYRFVRGSTGILAPNLGASYVDGGQFVAGWHTHPVRFDNDWPEYYSDADWKWVNTWQKPLYLGTPQGYIRVLRPGQKRTSPDQVHPKL